MTQEEKKLLLRDLSARLSYGVLCHINGDTNTPRKLSRIEVDELDGILLDFWTDREDYLSMQVYLSEVKPYLRPMSSMTEEEKMEFIKATDGELRYSEVFDVIQPMYEDSFLGMEYWLKSIHWLLKKHFDFNGLIPKGLAIEVTEENNPYRRN